MPPKKERPSNSRLVPLSCVGLVVVECLVGSIDDVVIRVDMNDAVALMIEAGGLDVFVVLDTFGVNIAVEITSDALIGTAVIVGIGLILLGD